MKKYALFLMIPLVQIVTESKGQDLFHIWEDGKIPYYKANNLEEYEADAFGTKVVYNVTDPTMEIFPAKGENTGKAVLILPGGGYSLEAVYHEGYEVAEYLADNGITGVVLKYRLPNPESSDAPHLVPITDTRQAMKLLREKAGQYSIDPAQIGVMGFSAGSHLATTACLWKSENEDENPNFSALIYGVTNLNEANLKWIEESLYYRKLTEDEMQQIKFLDLVSEETPSTFLVHAYDDDICDVSESTLYAEKLAEHNVSVEMHLFPSGGHGFGMGRAEGGSNQWPQLFVNWVKSNTF